MMLSKLLRKKKTFFTLFAILIIYLLITQVIWQKIPNEVYIPLRWSGLKEVGFYAKTLQNVMYVFITPAVGVLIFQIANVFEFGASNNLAFRIISKTIDLLCYLLVIMGPLAFLVCSFYPNEFMPYVFYIVGLIILAVNALFLRNHS